MARVQIRQVQHICKFEATLIDYNLFRIGTLNYGIIEHYLVYYTYNFSYFEL